MAPSATGIPAQQAEPESVLPPPVTYPPREARFENFVKPQPDGYKKAVSRGSGQAAIVIDNGILSALSICSRLRILTLFEQDPLPPGPVGPSKMRLD